MSAGYKAILWNRQKRIYDLCIVAGVILYLVVFGVVLFMTNPYVRPETIIIRGTASLAFLMLHVILVIGPLARLDNRFNILLYNRRHLGVSMFLIALVHGVFAIIQFHSLGDVNPILSIFISNPHYDIPSQFPFQPLGLFGLLIFFVMAATSHDYWLKNLSPRVWKTLHMLVYVAYTLIVAHVALGILQYESYPVRFGLVMIGVVIVVSLHVAAALKERRSRDRVAADDGFTRVCSVDDIAEDRARIVLCGGQEIAIFRYEGQLSAVHNLCKHQNGPLGEGRVIDGCITCPWHGYQYIPGNGRSPAPFNEKLHTYNVEVRNGDVYVDPEPLAEGTEVKPARI